ncbi:MAG: MBL fold metallo-hydrolase [Halanaerobiales bacterium]|nr:MBL fold metallo-hydrolase [Halanaerobiales bacterium]
MKKYSFVLFIIIIVLAFNVTLSAGQLEVNYLDVELGDSILIKTPNDKTILIDGGSKDSCNNLKNYLSKYEIKKLDYVISAVPHPNHIGGLLPILEEFKVEKVIDSGLRDKTSIYREYLDLIEQKNITYKTGRTGDKFQVGEIKFEVLHPDKHTYNLKNSSLVLLMKYSNYRFLFMGDVDSKLEEKLIQSNKNISAQILKVGNHGSNLSTSKEFLEKVSPRTAIISSGLDDNYPHAGNIRRLNQKNINIYRTNKKGTITIKTDGKSLSISTQYDSKVNTGINENTGEP